MMFFESHARYLLYNAKCLAFSLRGTIDLLALAGSHEVRESQAKGQQTNSST